MRANRVPRTERIQNRINGLENFESAAWVPKQYYPYCRHCNITNVQLSIDGDHRRGCPLRGHDKQVAYYKVLLMEARLEIR